VFCFFQLLRVLEIIIKPAEISAGFIIKEEYAFTRIDRIKN
jgi:hypothetical protein